MTFAQIESARERLRGQAHVTPVLTSHTLDQLCGAQVFLKCENFQRVAQNRPHGVLLSGGNVDESTLAQILDGRAA